MSRRLLTTFLGPVRAGLPCAALLGLLALLAPGCSDGEETSGSPPAPILLIGVDGLEWDVILPMLAEGELPALAALAERGAFGLLPTEQPTLSPVIWTTIATGKTREKHGILNFSRRVDDDRLRLYLNSDRKTKAFWNIASEYGRRVALVGWWMTYPVEEVNGVMVAQTNTVDQIDVEAERHIWKGAFLENFPGQVYPPARAEEMADLLADVQGELPQLVEEIFGTFPNPPSKLGARLWDNCMWAFRADATYVRMAERLLEDPEPYDLFAVYLGGPDVVGHRFWRYRQPEVYEHEPTAAEVQNFGTVIEDYYAYVDRAIGRLVEKVGPETRVFVISDHGMQPINHATHFDPESPPDDVNSAHHMTAPPGVIFAAGPDIAVPENPGPAQALQRADLRPFSSVRNVTPTLLALMGLPVGEDMDGTISVELIDPGFLERFPPRTVPSHDSAAWLEDRAKLSGTHPDSEARIQQLRDLGYIGAGLEDE